MPEERAVIDFTRDKVELLRKQYDQAVRKGEQEFTFEGHPPLVAYAKHLLDYLEGRFKS
jgi:hypothetical protein